MRFVKKQAIQGTIVDVMKKELSSRFADSSVSKKKIREKAVNPYFEFAFTLILEMIALFDMVGDIYLMISMY